jgi:hypothetical protein
MAEVKRQRSLDESFIGLIFGIFSGLVSGLFVRIIFDGNGRKSIILSVGLFGIVFGLLFNLKRFEVNFQYPMFFMTSFLMVYLRLFYVFPQFIKYRYFRSNQNSFLGFYESPVYFDEMIIFPLPYLKEWLLGLIRIDREKGLDEIFFIIEERPYQKKGALNALIYIIDGDLQKIDSIKGLSSADKILSDFPEQYSDSSLSIYSIRQYIGEISDLAQDYVFRKTHTGKEQALSDLNKRMSTFKTTMHLAVRPIDQIFGQLSIGWLKIIENEQEKLNQQFFFNTLPNPYVAGNPLQQRDESLFVGRSDILLAIEQFILNTDQRPSLLLYGRRRTGKSSTLLNLPRARFEPVYIDCQDAKWHESDQAFCYNLAHDIFKMLYQSDTVKGLNQPQIEQYEKNAFTQLDQFLNQAQKIAEQRGKRILLAFDEYEELENSIINGDISEKVLGSVDVLRAV